MVSAHAAAEPAPLSRYLQALDAGADYVELDIRRTADGELVAVHDPVLAGGQRIAALDYPRLCELAGLAVPRAADVLAAIRGRARGHLDLKVTGGEDGVAGLALDVLGPGQFVVTTTNDASAAAIRSRFPDPDAVPVALSLRPRLGDLRPLARITACGANWAALQHQLARAGAARQCRRQGLTVLVWTVNGERDLRYWLGRGRADVVVTDRPARAAALRAAAPGARGRR